MSSDDGPLRARALEALGPAGPALAREALELGTLEIEPHPLAWEGSLGHVTGLRAVLRVAPVLRARVAASPAAEDALVRAVAAAVAATPGRSLADLALEALTAPGEASRSPYR